MRLSSDVRNGYGIFLQPFTAFIRGALRAETSGERLPEFSHNLPKPQERSDSLVTTGTVVEDFYNHSLRSLEGPCGAEIS